MSQSDYKKLPGRSMTWSGPCRVWLGPDHVLLVLTRGYVESYRRFFFNDIQAFVVRRTHMGKVWNAIWASICVFFGAIAASVNDLVGSLVLAGIAAPLGIALLINLLRGPTCAFYIRTAVQTERVPAISHVRAAEKFIARVEPLVRASQGEWPQELANEFAALQFGQTGSPVEPQPAPAS